MNEQWSTTIQEWFRTTGGGGLMLPDGWFGRPYDNLHRLTFVTVRPLWLIMELDDRLLLTFREPGKVKREGTDLVIAGFTTCVFDQKDYAGSEGQVRSYKEGEVRLVAPPGV